MPGDHTLLESFDLDGFWGPPSHPEEQWVPGRLHFDPESGVELNLLGHFEQPKNELNNVWPYHESLFGLSKDLGKITLLGCQGTQTALKLHFNRSFFGAVRYEASQMIMGEHLPTRSDARYGSVIANFHNLEGFIGVRGLTVNVTEERHTLGYAHPPVIAFHFGKFAMTADYMLCSSHDLFKGELRQHGEVTACVDKEAALDEFLSGPLTAFHYLLQLSLGRRVPLTSLEGKSTRLTAEFDGEKFQRRTQIFFPQPRSVPVPETEHPLNMMFTLAGFGSEVSTYLDRWYYAFEGLRNVFDLYFSLDPEADTDVALEHHFLSAILALEGYHRAAGYNQHALSEEEHRKLLASVCAVTAPEHREWLNSRLQFNEKNLRFRLRELYDEQPDKVQAVLGSRKEFTNAVVNTRNSLAHPSSQKKGGVLGGLPLWLAIKQLRLVLQVCFLRQMQLPDPLLATFIDKSREYRILRFHGADGN